jgi:hypothetical protein
MVMRISRMGVAVSLFAASFFVVSLGAAHAEESIQKTCGDEWQAAKASGQVTPGTTWPKFLSDCRARHAGDAATTPAKPVTTAATPAPAAAAPANPPATSPSTTTPPASATQTATAMTPKSPTTGGREAMVARERQCGARWKQVKGTPALPPGITTWPKYWSWCNTRLKSGAAI